MKYEIGARLRQFREARGLSQRQLAELLHIGNIRISNWEQGSSRPDADMLSDLCTVLNVSPSELLGLHLTGDEYSLKETLLIQAYRSKPEMHPAVDRLLGLDKV